MATVKRDAWTTKTPEEWVEFLRMFNPKELTPARCVDLQEHLRSITDLSERLAIAEQLVADFQAAALINVGGMSGPCEVQPHHVERAVTEDRARITDLESSLEAMTKERDEAQRKSDLKSRYCASAFALNDGMRDEVITLTRQLSEAQERIAKVREIGHEMEGQMPCSNEECTCCRAVFPLITSILAVLTEKGEHING